MGEKTRKIKIGSLEIGGGNQIAVQSMTNTDTACREETLEQLLKLQEAGCDIARFSVNTPAAAANIPYFKARVNMPLVADIHFDYQLAVAAADAGADKIRINPGNIGDEKKIKAVCEACVRNGIPIRVGVNSGSVPREILHKYGGPTPQAIAESAVKACGTLENQGFYGIVVSAKSTNVAAMIHANRLLAQRLDYPLHIGVTEAGLGDGALVKSAIGIGALLADGIGDTLRVSITGDVVSEIEAAHQILHALGLKPHVELIACPTCGRTKINLITLAKELEEKFKTLRPEKTVKVALMGCAVNGPGEAAEADVGVAGGVGEALLYIKGVPVKKIPEDAIVPALYEEVKKMACPRRPD